MFMKKSQTIFYPQHKKKHEAKITRLLCEGILHADDE